MLAMLAPAIYGQQSETDSIKNVLNSNMPDTQRIHVLSQLTDLLPDGEWETYNRQMKELAEKKLAEKGNDRQIIKTYLYFLSEALHNEGVELSKKDEWKRATIAYKRSIYISKQIGDESNVAYTMLELAKAHNSLSENFQAIEILYEGLKIYEKLNDQEGVGDIYTELSTIYQEQENYEKAIEFAKKAFTIQQKIANESGMYEALTRLGLVYLSQENFEASVAMFEKGSLLVDSLDRFERMEIFKNKGLAYLGQKKYDDAIDCFKKSLENVQARSDRVATSYFLLCRAYLQKKEYAKAVFYGEKAMQLDQAIKNKQTIYRGAESLSIAYEKAGNATEALRMLRLSNSSRDSMDIQKTNRKLLEQQLTYDFSKKELIVKNENEKKMANLRLIAEKDRARKNIWLIVTLSLSIVFLIITVFLYNYFRQRNLIARQKESILKQKLLVSQMNPHFIFNSLNAIQNYIFKQDSLKAGVYLSQFAELMRMILDYSRRDLIKLSEEIKLLNNYFELQQLRFEFKFSYSIEVEEELEPSEVLIPPMLAQPFIENAIEHGIFYKEGKGNVFLRISRKDDKLVYEIEDDGVGLERSMELNKQKKKEHRSLATVITKERIESMDQKDPSTGKVEITDLSRTGSGRQGVKIRFVIPYREV